MASSATEVFFGGEAGGGKSWALLQDFLYDVGSPNANGILFRKTFPDLEDLIHKAIQHFADLNPTFNEAKYQFTFPSGARFRFSHLQHVNNIFTHAGQEYTYVGWDEVCHFPFMPYAYLFSRLRTTDPKLKPRVRATGNPDGEGVLWVKSRFIDVLKPYEIGWFKMDNNRDTKGKKGDEGCLSRQWIPTVRKENLALMQNDSTYEAMLDQLPEEKKRAYKYGIWDTFDRPYQLIKSEWWQMALSGKVEKKAGVAAIGADYAEAGDQCVTVVGRGNQVIRIREWPGMETHKFAKILYNEHMNLGHYQCFTGIDAVGPGVGVYHEMDKLGLGSRIEACKHKDPDFDAKYEKYQIKLHFNNWRTQAWWQLREDLENGEIDLSLLQTPSNFYKSMNFLQEEVFAHEFKILNGVVVITSKIDLRKATSIGRSPDRADALVIWNWMRHRTPTKIRRLADKIADYHFHAYGKFETDRTEAVAWT